MKLSEMIQQALDDTGGISPKGLSVYTWLKAAKRLEAEVEALSPPHQVTPAKAAAAYREVEDLCNLNALIARLEAAADKLEAKEASE